MMSPPTSANIPAEDTPEDRQEVIQVQILPQVIASQTICSLSPSPSPFLRETFSQCRLHSLWYVQIRSHGDNASEVLALSLDDKFLRLSV